jgi:hypothetical protein
MTADDIKTSKVLRAASDILGRGWCQGYLGRRDNAPVALSQFQVGAEIDEVCLQGALVKASVDLTGEAWTGENADCLTRRVYARAEQAVLHVINKAWLPFISNDQWNDRHDRTQAQVLEVLDRAAAAEEEAGR